MIFVYIFIGLLVLILLIASMMPKGYQVQQSIVIDKNPRQVMDRIGNLNDYSLWNPWQQADPTAKKTISGEPHQPGHKYAWDGKKTGIGSLTLLKEDDKNIHFDLEFIKPWSSKAKDNWTFESVGENQTKVTWENHGDLPWPMARLMGPMINKNLNQQFVKGLQNLKELCEKG